MYKKSCRTCSSENLKPVVSFGNSPLANNLLDSIEDENERFNTFVELNVKEQVFDLAKTSIVQSAWKNGQDLTLHGWTYGLNSGFVTDLKVNFSSDKDLDDVYQLKF